jgi:putative membrane protein (TIGR04086 family)
MYNKNRTPMDWVCNAGLCGGISMLLAFCLCMLMGIFVSKEILPQGAIPALAIGISLCAAFAGSLLSAKRLGERSMLAALSAAAVYLLLTLALKGLFFRGGFGQAVYLLPAAILGAVIAGFLGAKRKKRRK